MLDISLFMLGLNVNDHALPNGSTPLVFLDFKNGVYTANGATVTVQDLLVENADYGTWNPATMIDATGVGGVGVDSAAPVFTGAALDLILDGSTTLTTLTGTSARVTPFRYEMTDSLTDFNTYYYSGSSFDPVSAHGSNKITDSVHPNVLDAVLADGTHQIALTFIEGKISRSTDGNAIITINPAGAWSPAMAAMGLVVPVGLRVEQIGIYPAQADADLPMLSAL